MFRNFKIIILITGLILLNGCISFTSEVEIVPLGKDYNCKNRNEIQYKDYWEAIYQGNLAYAKQLNLNPEIITFIQGLDAIKSGEFNSAQEVFSGLFEQTDDSLVKKHSAAILGQILILQSKWEDYIALDSQTNFELDEESITGVVKAFNSIAEETYSFPNELVKIPISVGISGVPEIEVEVNGKKVKFWIDTGAAFSVVSSEIAGNFGLDAINDSKVAIGTSTDQKVSIQPTVINELKIGGLKINNHPTIILDKKDLEFKLFGFIKLVKIDGILGWNAIQKLDMTFDFPNKQLSIQKPVKKQVENRNFYWLEEPIVKICHEQAGELYYFLDCGDNTTSLYHNVLNKIDTTGITNKEEKIGGAGGFRMMKIKTIPELPLIIGQNKYIFKEISSHEVFDKPFFKLDGVIGNDITQNGIMKLDFFNGQFEVIIPPEK